MYRCILAPVDGTAFGEHALPYAAAVARRADAVLHLAHVHMPAIVASDAEVLGFSAGWGDLVREQGTGYLERLAERLAAAYGIRVQTRSMDGDVAEALEGCARECGAGLVVMSTHAHTGISRLWHHGVAEQLSRNLPLPLLLVRPRNEEEEPDLTATPEIRHLLVPLDGSEHAEEMLDHAVMLGRTFGARYTLVRVVRAEASFGASLFGAEEHAAHHQLMREQAAARQYLESVAERMRAAGLEVRTHVQIADDVGSCIVGCAGSEGEECVDLIAVEAHPHGTLSRLLGTHPADTVLRDSPVPVLAIRPSPVTVTARGLVPGIPLHS